MIDEAYEAIVTTMDRPVLVLAGPGAGKTYLLGDRVKRLLALGIPHSEITVLTFGRDASTNMRTKLLDTRDGFGIPHTDLPTLSTMHALGYQIVQKAPRKLGLRKTGLDVQPIDDAKELLYRDAALSIGLEDKVASSARRCKQEGDCDRGKKDSYCKVCSKYWAIMSKCNRIDYDDMVLFACEMLSKDPELLSEYQKGASHLLVDEYQDINAAQFKLIELLSKRSRAGLFVVGDDAQSIYGFRGGAPRFILNFEKDYPGALIAPLAHSRRCHEKIMDFASRSLKPFYPSWKGPFALRYYHEPVPEPVIWQAPSDEAEAKEVARIARRAVAQKKSLLVLAPKKEFFTQIASVLRDQKVPYQGPSNMLPNAVNDRFEIVFSILRWLRKPDDTFLTRLALEAVLNHGSAKVPGADKWKTCKPATIDHRRVVEAEVASLWENVNGTNSLWTYLGNLPATSSPELRLARDTLIGLLESFSASKKKLKGEFCKRLSLAVGAWMEPKKLVEDLCSVDKLLSANQPTGFGLVQLITMRKAKGLEADFVVMVGLEDDIIPNRLSPIDEQARLFYVSMTRAKEALYMIHSFKRRRNISFGPEITKKKRSRFLDAIGEKSGYKKR